jgi:hypothetical protein
MPRPRERVCLQDGLKLDLNQLARKGGVKPGANIGPRGVTWTSSYWGIVATGMITADMSGKDEGWLRIQLVDLDQWIFLVAHPRHFGGWQWYFKCPSMNQPVSVLWKPKGASDFRSRQAWGREVAYRSQFEDVTERAHAGKARVKSRLIGDLDPDEWDLPPKPKWMRWNTYHHNIERLASYQSVLDSALVLSAAKLGILARLRDRQ